MKHIIQNTLVLLLLSVVSAYANTHDVTATTEYQEIKKLLAAHDICQKDHFGTVAFNTQIGYYLKGDCTARVSVAVSKNGSFSKEGDNLEQLTREALDAFLQYKKTTQLNATLEKYNKDFNTVNKEGYRQCGASGLFAVMGIEKMSSEMHFVAPFLNQDKNFDCFGKALLDDCEVAEFTLLSYLGREFDMHFKTQKEAGLCSLTYVIPLPSAETIEAYKNTQIFPDADKPLPKGKALEGKLDDIYGFISSKDNHMTIDENYFENEYGAREKNRGTFAFFTIMFQQWRYFLMGM